jgi:hypothetical protein
MPELITAKIDLAKIHGAKVLEKNGRTFLEITDAGLFVGSAGARYLDLALFATPGGEYGDYRITQDLPKARRDAGERGAILGNGKVRSVGGSPAPAPRPAPAPQADDDSEIPF